ncbi:MAG: hypothetical protein BWY71_01668 [Planctomycetes bacterium ADurb.Bin412]|nr:MAG: hypothetical protein BWY71_01668 [Planctomycetes bacterium ADurb.Bin412]
MQPLTGPEDVIAQDPGLLGVRHRLLHAFDGQGILGPDIDIGLIRPDGPGGNHQAFDQAVRIAFHDRAIHECTRIAFVRVAYYVFFDAVLHAGGFPFPSGGETAAAAAAQAGTADFLTNAFGRHLRISLFGRFIPAHPQIFVETLRIQIAHIPQNHMFLPVEEGNLGGIAAGLAGVRLMIEQMLDNFTFPQGLADDFFHVRRFHPHIQDVIRQDRYQRGL